MSNISGHRQLYTLDCEARSSVDLAAYFGIDIDENDFLNRLPRSDDPNEGFVGNLGDPRGQIPPNSYGVHAAPIAALLREYGLNASAQYGFGFESLKSEIAAGRPVLAWVIGNTTSGFGTSYTPSNGNTTIVAPYEHTVLVIGYNSDTVTLLDENNIYNRSTSTFVNSWAVLGNMAVTVAN
ncbi:MAG: C39 family peptidase [Anaerolineae bacterium]|nr:C39 family peptidase [Anaerolineae bacterium]